jgi:hypothetical protein
VPVTTTLIETPPMAANGTVRVFPFTLPVIAAGELAVLDASTAPATELSPSTYTVQLLGSGQGIVTFAVAPASPAMIVVRARPDALRTPSFTDSGPFLLSAVSEGFDRSVARDLHLKDETARALRAPRGEPQPSLPAAAARAGKYLCFDQSGLPVVASGTGSDPAFRSDIAAAGGAALIGYRPPGSNLAARTVAEKLAGNLFDVRDYGAKGDGTTDDTAAVQAAINAAIASMGSTTNPPKGATIYLPPGNYLCKPLNLNDASGISNSGNGQYLRMIGAGPGSTIVSAHASVGSQCQLNFAGRSNFIVGEMTLFCALVQHQCGLLTARTNNSYTSPGTAGNAQRFLVTNLQIIGNYSVACAVSIGCESSVWVTPRFRSSAGSGTCFASGIDNSTLRVTVPSGDTIASVSSPATDNRMVSPEFYSVNGGVSAGVVRFSKSSAYTFFHSTIVAGGANNRLVVYADSITGIFTGAINWVEPHFEVFGGAGAGNVVHYLANTGLCYYYGINSIGGLYQTDDGCVAVDYDRTAIANQPILCGARWTSPANNANTNGLPIYLYAMIGCTIDWRVFSSGSVKGRVVVLGFAADSLIAATNPRIAQLVRTPADQFVDITTAAGSGVIPTSGTWAKGQRAVNSGTAGASADWVCTASGTVGTMSGVTATVAAGSNVVTLAGTAANYAAEGELIAFTGYPSGGPFRVARVSGNTAYLGSNVPAAIPAGTAVSYSSPTFSNGRTL